MTAAALLALAAEARTLTLLVRGTADQHRLMGHIPVTTKEKA